MADRGGSERVEPPKLTVGQLEASYPTYCKALRILILEGNSLNQIKGTLCWQRLELLHKTMPRQYRDPVVHYGMTKRAVEAEAAARA